MTAHDDHDQSQRRKWVHYYQEGPVRSKQTIPFSTDTLPSADSIQINVIDELLNHYILNLKVSSKSQPATKTDFPASHQMTHRI